MIPRTISATDAMAAVSRNFPVSKPGKIHCANAAATQPRQTLVRRKFMGRSITARGRRERLRWLIGKRRTAHRFLKIGGTDCPASDFHDFAANETGISP